MPNPPFDNIETRSLREYLASLVIGPSNTAVSQDLTVTTSLPFDPAQVEIIDAQVEFITEAAVEVADNTSIVNAGVVTTGNNVTATNIARDLAIGVANTTEGLAKTVNGQFFVVREVGVNYETRYQNVGGSAVFIVQMPSKSAVDALPTAAAIATVQTSIDAITADPTNAVTEIFIPAKAFDQGASSGAVYKGVPTGANSARLSGWSLPDVVTSHISTLARLPSHWNTANVDVIFVNEASSVGNVSLSMGFHNWGIGETINAAPSGASAQTVAGAAPSSAWISGKISTTGALVVDVTRYNTIRISRNGASGSDTLLDNITVLGVSLRKAS